MDSNDLQNDSMSPIVEDTSKPAEPETTIVINETSTASSTVVAGRDRATGGATMVEGTAPSAGACAFGNDTMELIAEEARDAAATLEVQDVDGANEPDIQNDAKEQQTDEQEIAEWAILSQPVGEQLKRKRTSKGGLVISVIIGIAAAVAAFVGVTIFMQGLS